MGIESTISSLPMLMSMLPLLMQASQIMFNLFFIWFFGSMATRGYRGHKPFLMKMVCTLLVGSLCLVGGAAFSGFIPFVGSGILSIMHLDILIAGLLVSIVLAAALHLITHNNPSWRPEEMVDILRRKVVTLEEMLKTKAHHITETDARKIAEGVMKGYSTVTAKLIGNEYEVGMKKGDNEGKVIIDAWDGEIKNRIMHESAVSRFFTDAHKMAGLVMIIAVILASAVFFEGFSDPNEQIAAMFGMSADDLGDLASSLNDSPLMQAGDIPEGCVSPIVLGRYSSQMQDSEFRSDHMYDDQATRNIVEQNCGDSVSIMLRLDHEGKDLIMAFTAGGQLAYLTDGIFCACLDTSV